MTREEAKKILQRDLKILERNKSLPDGIEAMKVAIESLEQEPVCDRLAGEYISKVKCCDECFASTFCTINGLRNSRVPQSYCIENIKKYFESKSEVKE